MVTAVHTMLRMVESIDDCIVDKSETEVQVDVRTLYKGQVDSRDRLLTQPTFTTPYIQISIPNFIYPTEEILMRGQSFYHENDEWKKDDTQHLGPMDSSQMRQTVKTNQNDRWNHPRCVHIDGKNC